MIPLGLSATDLALFNRSLCTHHSMRSTVQVLDLNHNYLGDVSDQLLDGQVNIDINGDVTRNLTAQLNDPERTLKLDSTAPTDGALFYDRMLRIIYSVKSELLPRWVDVPIFCGPITKLTRTADVLNVEAKGKESLALPPAAAWYAHTYGKGWNRAALVRELLRQTGELRFTAPAFGDKTPGPVVVQAETNLWALAKAVNGSFGNRVMFYDGRGVLVMRSTPKTSTYTFRTGVGGNIMTLPTIDFDMDAARNVVRVKGAVPKGKKTPITESVGLPRSHPLNHWTMGRGGKPRVLLEVVSDDNQKTASQARKLAQAKVNQLALEAVDTKFDALVAPHLEPFDIFTVRTPDFSVNARYGTATIPLKSAVGNVGYLAKVSSNRTRIRRR